MSIAELHRSLKSRGKGAKDWINSWTEHEYLGKDERGRHRFAATLSSEHRVFKDNKDGQWKKSKFTDNRPDHVVIQSAQCCVEIHPYYAKYFDLQHEEVRIEEERWVVQRLFKEPDTWRDVGAWNPMMTVEASKSVIKVTVAYDTDYGLLTVEYVQTDGCALKHNVTFTNTSGSQEQFRVLQRWSGIVADEVNNSLITAETKGLDRHYNFTKNGKTVIRENLSSLPHTLEEEIVVYRRMWKREGECIRCGACCPPCVELDYDTKLCDTYEDRPLECREFPWRPGQLAHLRDFNTGDTPQCGYTLTRTELEEELPTKFRKAILDVHSKGLKADFVYGYWGLANGESLEIDPNTYSTDNPNEDGYVEKNISCNGVEGHCSWAEARTFCLADSPQRPGGTAVYMGGYSSMMKWWYVAHAYRGYIEWDISGVPTGAIIDDVVFKYEGSTPIGATDGEIKPITEEAPSDATDVNLWDYCATGVAYVDPWNVITGENQSQDLGVGADQDLQDAVDAEQSWFAIGFYSPADECPGTAYQQVFSVFLSEEGDTPTPKPTLFVTYTPGITDASEDLPAQFIVSRSSSQELASGFIVRGDGSQDLAASFDGQVSLNLPAEFVSRQAGSQDLPAEFEARRDALQELPCEFIVRQPGSQELLGEFISRQAGSQELLAEFIIRRDGSQELFGELVIRRDGSQELGASFDAQVSLNLSAAFVARRDGSQELLAEFDVQRSALQELPGELVIRRDASQDLAAEFISRQSTSQELLAEFITRQAGSQDLLAEFFVEAVHASVELAAEFYVDDTLSITGITKDKAGNRLGNCEIALFRVEAGNPPTYTFIASDTSDGNGDYTFTGLTKRSFFVRAQKDGAPNVFDTTDNELDPV